MKNIEKYKDVLLNAETNDLTCCVIDLFHNGKCPNSCKVCKQKAIEWLLEEAKESILGDVEKEYLSAVINPFRKIIVDASKHRLNNDLEYIAIRVKSLKEDEEENMCFPAFKIGTMYKGMELDKKYRLEDLSL